MAETTGSTHVYSYPGYQSSSYEHNVGAPPGHTTLHDSHSFMFMKGTVGTSGVKNPRYLDQIKAGINATTSFSGTSLSVNASPATISVYSKTTAVSNPNNYVETIASAYGIFDNPSEPSRFNTLPVDVSARVRNRCIADFLSACETARSSFEAGQDIGEYKETLHSIQRPLSSMQDKLLSYFDKLKRARRGAKPSSLPKVLADTYLELRFGVLPLADDVASAIADAGRFRFPVIPVRGSAHERYSASAGRSSVSYNLVSGFGPTMQVNLHSDYSLRYKGAIRSGSDGAGQIGRAQAWQLLPRDWLPTAWDLLPYSWIADYFTNIGDMVKSLSFVSSDLVWACKTSRTRNIVTYNGLQLAPAGPLTSGFDTVNDFQASGGDVEMIYTIVSRDSLNGSDLMPSFAFRIPTSKYPYYNLAALLVSRAIPLVPYFRGLLPSFR